MLALSFIPAGGSGGEPGFAPPVRALAKAPIFGWAKPVPVDYRQLRNPRRDMVIVALAGPGMNFLLALVASLGLLFINQSGAQPEGAALFVAQNLFNFLLINIFLAVFNLIPLPPFDGGHVVEGFLPRSAIPAWRARCLIWREAPR